MRTDLEYRLYPTAALPMTPIEQAYKVFSDYMVKAISYPAYRSQVEALLAGRGEDMRQFEEAAAFFQKNLMNAAGDPSLLSRNIAQAVESRPFVVSRRPRFAPPILEEHSFMELIYLYAGSATYLSAGKELKMETGDFCIIAPYTRHNLYCHDEDAIMLSVFMRQSVFNQNFQNTLAQNDSLSAFFLKILYQKTRNISLVFRTGTDENLHRIMDRLLEEYHREDGMSMRLVSDWLHLFLSYMVRDHSGRAMTLSWDSLEVYDEIAPIIGYIQENLADVTLTSVAEHFFFSEGYLSRMIKHLTGSTFRALLKSMRMDHAMLLFRQVGSTPEQVMREVGYTDLAYFSKSFQQHAGCTIQEFIALCNRDEAGNVLNMPTPAQYTVKITDSAKTALTGVPAEDAENR